MQQFRNNTALFSFNIIRAGFELHMYHMRPGRGRSVFLQICNSRSSPISMFMKCFANISQNAVCKYICTYTNLFEL